MSHSPTNTTPFTAFLSPFVLAGLPFCRIYLYFLSTQASDLFTFLFSTSGLPLHIYLILLLRLPSVYEARAANGSTGSTTTQAVPPQSFVTEWRSLMAISTLILSAVLTIFQLPGAFADPLLRLAGFLSILFSFFGFHYGRLLINQVGSSGTAGAAVTENVIESGGVEFQATNRWIQAIDRIEAHRNGYWNISVLLALPAIWTAWSVTAFISMFIILLCRASRLTPISTVTVTAAELVPVMLVMVIGTVYFVFAIRALRSW